jgi:hypothetical protein
MANFEERNGKLFVNGKEVLKGWESVDGWFWFATEKVQERESLIDGRWVKDTIWFGFVQGFEEEWGDSKDRLAGKGEIWRDTKSMIIPWHHISQTA